MNASPTEEQLQRNLRLYFRYQAACGFLPWLPIFFLYFYERVTLPQALEISAVYYLTVVLLEVPSGYLSDRYGRRPTLIMSSIAAICSYAVFIVADSYVELLLGQCLLAMFFALKSGSDNSLLYDTLKALGKEGDYARYEAQSLRIILFFYAIAAVFGGFSGYVDLRIPYAFALIAALLALYYCSSFKDPAQERQPTSFTSQISYCLSSLRDTQLRWLFVFFIAGYTMQHVIAEFNQPLIKLLQIGLFSESDLSAPVSGLLVAVSMLGGMLGTTLSLSLAKRLGVTKLMLLVLVSTTAIVVAMCLWFHPWVLVFIMFRNLPMALAEAPMLAAIAPRIDSSYRATYLSMQSLAGRLSFACLLGLLATILQRGDGPQTTDAVRTMTRSDLQLALVASLVFAAVTFVLLWWRRPDMASADEIRVAPQK